MNSEKLIKLLSINFGDSVKVRSQYHIQVNSSKGYHDIWLNSQGEMKFKLAGNRNALMNNDVNFIVNQIKLNHKSHLDKMNEMLDLAKFINKCEKLSKETGIAIFTDAGFKDGKARIAAVYVNGNDIEAKSKLIEVDSVSSAEAEAIRLGIEMNPYAIVYNDNESIVKSMNNNRIKWIPREENKAADRIGNMRN